MSWAHCKNQGIVGIDIKPLAQQVFTPDQIFSRIVSLFSFIALALGFVVAGVTVFIAPVLAQSTSLPLAAAPPGFFDDAPENDNLAKAFTINMLHGVPGSGNGTNFGATGEAGEPLHHAPGVAPIHSVWWKFTAVATGVVQFDTFGSKFDTVLAVYRASGFAPPPVEVTDLIAVASDDNGGTGLDGQNAIVNFAVTAGTTYYVAVDGSGAAFGVIEWAYTFTANQSLVASVLPGVRAIQLPGTVTAFANIHNFGTTTATGCSISLPAPIPGATFLYQTVDGANVPTGTPNTPVNIPANMTQGFYFAISATVQVVQNIELVFDCANTAPVTVINGVNKFWMTAVNSPVPDMIAVSATIGNTGYITIPGIDGQQLATAAVVNIGTTGDVIAVVTEHSFGGLDPNMAADLVICRTDAAGTCLTPFSPQHSFTAIAGVPYFFTILAIGTGTVADDPAVNRAYLYFISGFSALVGATSVAVRTAP